MINPVFSSITSTSVKNGYTSTVSKEPSTAPNKDKGAVEDTEVANSKDNVKENLPEQAVVQAAVTKLNDYVQNIRRTLSFNFDERTGHTVIQVYDSETEELIREIPPEETIKLAASIEASVSTSLIQERKV